MKCFMTQLFFFFQMDIMRNDDDLHQKIKDLQKQVDDLRLSLAHQVLIGVQNLRTNQITAKLLLLL